MEEQDFEVIKEHIVYLKCVMDRELINYINKSPYFYSMTEEALVKLD